MPGHQYTIEELMLDDSFINYCLSTGAAVPSKWRMIIRDNPEQEKIFEEARKLVLSLHGGLSRLEISRQVDSVRRQLKERTDADADTRPEPGPSLSSAFVVTDKGEIKRRVLRALLPYAAIAGLLLVVGWLFFSDDIRPLPSEQEPALAVLNYQSPLGERKKITLPDGSMVILNSNSQLSLEPDFNKKKRIVLLKGEAFFKVAKNAERPFIVNTENIATTALGTEFYIHGGKEIEVDLLEGKVQLENVKNDGVSKGLILFPGEMAKQLKGNEWVKGVFDSLSLRSWISDRIYFNETPVLKALKQLENWYGIEIRVKKGGLTNRFINGEYKQSSLQDILKIVCFSINCQYSVKDNIVIIE